jgi:hypothetical protein
MTVIHPPDPLHALGVGLVVGRHDEGRSGAFGPGDDAVEHGGARDAIELSGRLVGEDQARRPHDCPSQRDALGLAARELLRQMAGQIRDTKHRQRRPGARFGLLLVAGEQQRQLDIFEAG